MIGRAPREDSSMTRRWWVAHVLPPMAMLAWVVFPLARGSDTLYLRDVLATHLPVKHAQAEAMRSGELPLIDPYRALGQPLLGNPNAVPLYPDNLLYLVAPTLWALNAHFWIHWLLAAPAMAALGRAWGLTRRGAWAAGVIGRPAATFSLSSISTTWLPESRSLRPSSRPASTRPRRARAGGDGPREPAPSGRSCCWPAIR
jgi:hypothetical protein